MRPDAYIERALAPLLTTAMAEARVVALLGARQAGKSTLARVLAGSNLRADYLTLDDEPVRSLAAGDPVGFVSGLAAPVVIDEVQRAPEVLLAIKSRVDRDDRPGQFLLTGSANLRRLPTVADALPGRVDYHTLWPLTQAEIEGEGHGLLDSLFAGRVPAIAGAPPGRDAHLDRLLAGGFPEARRRSGDTRRRFFDSYVTSIVEREVIETSRIHQPVSVTTLLRLIASRSGSLARYERLGRDAGIDGKTAKAHVEILERLYLVRVRLPWHVNLGKRQVKAPKLYIADPGLLAALISVDKAGVSADDGIAGSLYESFVATELERLASWAPEHHDFWHYRDGAREVDVVIERPSGAVVGVEVKSGATVRAADFAGLVRLRDRLGQRFRSGVVIHTGERTLPFGDRLWALPLPALWTSPSRGS